MLPVTLIGGYLGAGKTTLVNHLLRHADGQRLAVLVNEFGALPIDEDLIEAQDETLISIAGGCVCCSYGNDLIQAIVDLTKLAPQPDHILIEASGVAIPGAIASSLSLIDGVVSDGIVILADAETIQAKAKDDYVGDTIERQLADANLVLLTKADLVAPARLQELSDWMAGKAPDAAVVPVSRGNIPNGVILQGFIPKPLAQTTGAAHHTLSFQSKILNVSEPVDAEKLAKLLADPAHNLVRAKGFVPTTQGLRTVQIVGRRWEISDAPPGSQAGVVMIAEQSTDGFAKIEAALANPSKETLL